MRKKTKQVFSEKLNHKTILNPLRTQKTENFVRAKLTEKIYIEVAVYDKPKIMGNENILTEARLLDNTGQELSYKDADGSEVSGIYFGSKLSDSQIMEELIPFWKNHIDLILI